MHAHSLHDITAGVVQFPIICRILSTYYVDQRRGDLTKFWERKYPHYTSPVIIPRKISTKDKYPQFPDVRCPCWGKSHLGGTLHMTKVPQSPCWGSRSQEWRLHVARHSPPPHSLPHSPAGWSLTSWCGFELKLEVCFHERTGLSGGIKLCCIRVSLAALLWRTLSHEVKKKQGNTENIYTYISYAQAVGRRET